MRALALLCLAMTAAAQTAPPAIDDARLSQLRELLAVDKSAPWRNIAWQIDLLAAQRLAVAQRKPLFVWAMDGHPLGCT